jgi:hypothetical protein
LVDDDTVEGVVAGTALCKSLMSLNTTDFFGDRLLRPPSLLADDLALSPDCVISLNCLPALLAELLVTRLIDDRGVKKRVKRFGVTGGGFLSLREP